MGRKKLLPQDLFFSRTSDFLDIFLVSQCNKSIKTSDSYRDALTVFKRYVICRGKNILTFRYTDCTYEFLLDYKEYLGRELHYEPSSINQRLAAIKAYMKYSYGCDPSLLQVYLSIDAVPFSSVPRVQREILSEEDVAFLLNQPPSSKKGLRDTLILSILFDAAIRLDELVQLTVGDIYRQNGCTYLLIHGKGNKERLVPVPKGSVPVLKRYLEIVRPLFVKKPMAQFFVNSCGRPVTVRYVELLVREKCDIIVSLPMKGSINSLNASVAAGILMYHALKGRS